MEIPNPPGQGWYDRCFDLGAWRTYSFGMLKRFRTNPKDSRQMPIPPRVTHRYLTSRVRVAPAIIEWRLDASTPVRQYASTIVRQSFAQVACLGQSISPLPESRISTSPPVLCSSHISWPVRQSFARVAYLGQSVSPLPKSRISISPPVLCPSRVSRSVLQFFARVAYLGHSASPLPESRISVSPLVLCPSHVSRLVRQSFARVAYLGQSASPLPELRISASPLILCPSCISRPVHQLFTLESRSILRPNGVSRLVACLSQSTSLSPELRISASPLVLCPSHVPRPVRQSFARVAYLASPPVLCLSYVSRPVH
ncbi:hypothetical protein B296_00006563 [Ensete ventricosum]|uniref:Uncharacterized protein n=1 Tax=Ensete ventricosum TaxID=4639 RepID=A0A426ZK79_ENSVE|nr:hypothetical protein B296_00006563 [Ensete ventricosum]